jgi:hypothetical protein
VILQVTPAIPQVLWLPVPTIYGLPLDELQLDALTRVPGNFAYTPGRGTILSAGTHQLSAVFTPNDTRNFQTVTVHAELLVFKALPRISWEPPAPITTGTPLNAAQLDATANVPGTFAYSPAAGAILPVGTSTLKATFTPADGANYQTVTVHVTLTVKSH